MRSSYRAGGILLVALTWAGCQTKSENLPLEVARNRVVWPTATERAAPATVSFPEEVVRMAGGLWQVGFKEYQLPERLVQPVGSAGGLTFYALSWDAAPYGRLLAGVPGRPGAYREFLGVY